MTGVEGKLISLQNSAIQTEAKLAKMLGPKPTGITASIDAVKVKTEAAADGINTVSYQHLDVYKRQK